MQSDGQKPIRGRLPESAFRSALVVLASFAGGLVLLLVVLTERPDGAWMYADIAVGAMACLTLTVRDRAPSAVAVVLAIAAAVVATAGIANYVALFAVARRRRIEVAFCIALVDIVAAYAFWTLYPANASLSLTIVVNIAIALAVVAWGALQQTQQDLVEVYRDRALRIERERELQAEQIRMAERARIARDMHDSVAHCVSLISLYAGGLEVGGVTDARTVSETGSTIRQTAVRALDELRTAIGLLRDGTPAPTAGAGTVTDLVDAARIAGQLVVADVDHAVSQPDHPAAANVYRIVQEGLTNARKHAPRSLVTVEVVQCDNDVLVTITNPVDPDRLPAAGTRVGLTGLAERAESYGGTVEYGESPPGSFRLHGRLPCR